jgi:DNA-binding NarL/FixJ family response regulator
MPYGVMALIAVQVLCAIFFASDIVADLRTYAERGLSLTYLSFEAAATASLCAAILFEVRYVLDLLRRKASLERSASIAAMALSDVIEAHFDQWSLTPSEKDVATFMVKGFSIGEIATLRGSAEGTVKAHLNAIYRKSGTHSRADVLSLIIDTLMNEPASNAA